MSYRDLTFPKGSRILVTGGAGFIGTNLCEALLALGCHVRCLDDFSTGKRENIACFADNPHFELLEGDIRDYDTCYAACDGMEYVSHQAAWGSVPRSIEMPRLYEQINIGGMLNMLEAARKRGIKRFVYASSSSVYGDNPALPMREGQEGRLLSPYALTKRVNEEYGGLYRRLYGFETIGLRYFNVFGRRQNPQGPYAAVIPRFIQALLKNEAPTIFGDGMQSRDFTYIDNVLEANIRALLAPIDAAGEVFNIAFGEQKSLLDIHRELCVLLEKDIPPVFTQARPGDIRHSSADISKARRLIGYAPEYDFARGLRLSIAWYKKGWEETEYEKNIHHHGCIQLS